MSDGARIGGCSSSGEGGRPLQGGSMDAYGAHVSEGDGQAAGLRMRDSNVPYSIQQWLQQTPREEPWVPDSRFQRPKHPKQGSEASFAGKDSSPQCRKPHLGHVKAAESCQGAAQTGEREDHSGREAAPRGLLWAYIIGMLWEA